MSNQDGSITDNDVVVVDSLDTEGLKKQLETSLAQKKHWREKAEREASEKAQFAARIAEFEKASKPLPTETSPGQPKPAGTDVDSLIDNLSALRGLGDDEVNELRNAAKDLGVDPVKYIRSVSGQAHLKEFRSTKKSQDSTPTPSNRIPVFNGKPVHDILKDEKATSADKQKAFESMVKGRKGLNTSV